MGQTLSTQGEYAAVSILQWIQDLGWRVWILILVPVLAGIIAYFVVADEPPDYRAISSMVAPVDVSASPTPQVVNQAVANLQALVASTAFTEAAAAEAGVSESALRDGLGTSRVGAGTILEITFTSTDAGQAVSVATVVGHRAASTILTDDLVEAVAAVDLAASDLATADAAVAAAVASNEGDPVVFFDLAIAELAQAQAAKARAIATGGDDLGLRAIEAEIEVLQAQVDAMVPIVAEYQKLNEASSAAEAAFNDAWQHQRSVEALVISTEQSVVDPTGAAELSNRIPVAQKVVTVVLLAFVLALVIVIVLDLVRPNRTEPKPETPLTAPLLD